MQFGHALCCVLCSALPLVVMEDLSTWMSSELCTACSVTAIMLCCSYAVLCAVCMQLDAGRALLCAAVLPVCSCALVCSAVCVALLCCAASCCAMCVLCSNEQLRCVGRRSAMLSKKVCCALVCLAVLCCAVRWNRRVIPNRQNLCGWPGVRHHAGC